MGTVFKIMTSKSPMVYVEGVSIRTPLCVGLVLVESSKAVKPVFPFDPFIRLSVCQTSRSFERNDEVHSTNKHLYQDQGYHSNQQDPAQETPSYSSMRL